jgi:hypothetical protein
VQVRHVGGDHANDSTVMFVEPDVCSPLVPDAPAAAL